MGYIKIKTGETGREWQRMAADLGVVWARTKHDWDGNGKWRHRTAPYQGQKAMLSLDAFSMTSDNEWDDDKHNNKTDERMRGFNRVDAGHNSNIMVKWYNGNRAKEIEWRGVVHHTSMSKLDESDGTLHIEFGCIRAEGRFKGENIPTNFRVHLRGAKRVTGALLVHTHQETTDCRSWPELYLLPTFNNNKSIQMINRGEVRVHKKKSTDLVCNLYSLNRKRQVFIHNEYSCKEIVTTTICVWWRAFRSHRDFGTTSTTT